MTAIRNAMPDEELAEASEDSEPEKGRWSQSDQLLALVADRVARLEYITICANSDSKGRKPQAPEPVRRPGAQQKKPRPRLTESGAERLFQLINGGAS